MALLGILVLNLLFLIAGSCMLWAARGLSDWAEWLRLSGVSYLLGVAVSAVLMTLVLVYGGGASALATLGVTCGPAALGLGVGLWRRRPLPRGLAFSGPATPSELAAWALGLGTAGMLAAFFRQARVDPLRAWDAWAFWVPKAKVIYFFGGIDSPLFRTFTGSNYPLLVPALSAMDFRFMGAADTTTLAVQYWLLLVGFVAAMVGLLRTLAPAWLIWLFAASVVVLPQLDERLLNRQADWPLDIFAAVAALAAVRWVVLREPWALGVFGVLLSAAMATKREGEMLSLCLVLGVLAALGVRERRRWLLPVAVAAAAYAVNIPWRLWWTSRHLTSDTPPHVLSNTFHLGRAPASVWLVVRILFDPAYWVVATPVALVAAILALTSSDRRAARLFLAAMLVGVLGFAWATWSDPSLPIVATPALNPTNRLVGALTLLSLVFAPLLLAPFLRPDTPDDPRASVEPRPAPAGG